LKSLTTKDTKGATKALIKTGSLNLKLETSKLTLRDTPSGATFAVRVHPRAKKNAVAGLIGDALKLSLTAPPVEGRANDACIAFLAELLKVPRSSITIAAGASGRNKVVRVAGVTADAVRQRLELL
jgi:uncharacterized protein